MHPKISVIIPVYNVEKYLERCLDSVFEQTLDSFEVICIDDGSTDASPRILAQYAAKHPALHILWQKNSGSSVARNRGIDAAKGEYIYFIDSDDRLLRPDALALLYERAASLRLDELMFSAADAYENDVLAQKRANMWNAFHMRGSYPADLVLPGQEMFLLQMRNDDFFPSLWRRLYRRAFLAENKLYFVEGIIHQDFIFSLECIALCERAACMDLTAYEYCFRPNSVSTGSSALKRTYAHIWGALSLERFAAERLKGANPDFLAAYLNRTHEWIYGAANDYLKLPANVRRGLAKAIPAERRKEALRYFRAPLARERRKHFRVAVKRHVPPALWAQLKKLKGPRK